MGYSFYLVDKTKPIAKQDFDTAYKKLSPHNKGSEYLPLCDTKFEEKFIRVSGAFGISGKDAEGFVLNLLINLQQLGYVITVLSGDWEYGTKEDWQWFDKYTE